MADFIQKTRTSKQYILLMLKGIAMGAADVVPGVSGGTIAFISGIYQELVETISGIGPGVFMTLKEKGVVETWKSYNLSFLFFLILGMLISVFSLMKLVHFLLENHPIPLWSFFLGLVSASVLFIAKQIKVWKPIYVILSFVSCAGAFYITQMSASSANDSIYYLFFSGAIASCAMILPGISGSFILLLLGAYSTITTAVHEMDFKRIFAVAFGVLAGLLSFSHFLKWLFNNHKDLTLSVLTGFILGSLAKIWPWKIPIETITIKEKTIILKGKIVLPSDYTSDPQLGFALAMTIIGFGVIMLLERVANKK